VALFSARNKINEFSGQRVEDKTCIIAHAERVLAALGLSPEGPSPPSMLLADIYCRWLGISRGRSRPCSNKPLFTWWAKP